MNDNRRPYDPFNFMADGDYNIHKHKMIGDELYKHYFPYGKKCETCKLHNERVIPECYVNCNLWNHWADGKHSFPRIETRQLKVDPMSIYISRPMFLFNYYNKIPFIMRCTSMNGLIAHHKDFNKWNDSPENVVILTSKEHSFLHATYGNLRKKIDKLLEDCKNNPDRLDSNKLETLNNYISTLRLMSKVGNSFRLNRIIYEVALSMEQDQIYIPLKEWAVNTGHSDRTKKIIEEQFYDETLSLNGYK